MKKAVSYLGLIAGGLLLAGSVNAQSDGLNYSYVESGLSVLDLDGDIFDREGGFNIRGSISLNESLYLQGTWDRWEVLGTDTDNVKLGLGYRIPVADASDVFFEGSYVRIEAGESNEDGARLDAGFRHAFSEKAEGRIFGGVIASDEDEVFVAGADVLINLVSNFGLNIGYETEEFDDHIYRFNLRYSF